MKITNVRLVGNEKSGLRPNTIYAELRGDNGELEIAATLEHILVAIRDRGLKVDGVTFETSTRSSYLHWDPLKPIRQRSQGWCEDHGNFDRCIYAKFDNEQILHERTKGAR